MILAVQGSPRKGGNSEVLMRAALGAAAGAGAVGRGVRLAELRFSSCTGCEKCRKTKACTGLQDDMTALYPALEASRGLILVSPVHHYNVSALTKAFIDRLYCYYDFEDTRPRGWSSRLSGQGRKAVIAAVAEQERVEDMGFALEAMRLPLQALGFEIVAEVPVRGVFDRGAVADKPSAVARAEEAGRILGRAMTVPGG